MTELFIWPDPLLPLSLSTQNFSEGPHRRIVGPGSVKESSFTNVFLYPKKYYKTRPFVHPRDRQFEGARMGSYVTCMDGLVEKRVRPQETRKRAALREQQVIRFLSVRSLPSVRSSKESPQQGTYAKRSVG